MANPSPSSDPRNKKSSRSLREIMDASNGSKAPARASTPPKDDPWGDDDRNSGTAEERVEITSGAEHEAIVGRLQSQETEPGGQNSLQNTLAQDAEHEKLAQENEELRSIIAELRQLLDESASKGQESFEDREKEYEAMLDEKSDVIRTLHVKIQEMEAQLKDAPAAPPAGGGGGENMPNNEELEALNDELERERCQLEQERTTLEDDRRQLREDEEAMMRQMREMELQMAKERAELARQRNELQRLHSEIRHELELAQRDAAVNERLRMLTRRHQEVGEPGAADEGDRPKSKPSLRPPKSQEPPKKEGSSIMRRLFGGDK